MMTYIAMKNYCSIDDQLLINTRQTQFHEHCSYADHLFCERWIRTQFSNDSYVLRRHEYFIV